MHHNYQKQNQNSQKCYTNIAYIQTKCKIIKIICFLYMRQIILNNIKNTDF